MPRKMITEDYVWFRHWIEFDGKDIRLNIRINPNDKDISDIELKDVNGQTIYASDIPDEILDSALEHIKDTYMDEIWRKWREINLIDE